jgi:hypothetical protein
MMKRKISPGSAMLFVAITFVLLPFQQARAQGPTGAGTQTNRWPAEAHGQPSSHDKAQPNATQPDAAESGTQSSSTPTATDPAAKATLADLAWLAGSWQGFWGPRIAQQVWTPPNSGVMLGSFQLAENDKTLVVEIFTLTQTPEGIELRIRHFTPSLVPWEKDGATVLKLTSLDAKSAVFENFVNGEPKTQSMRRMDADTYTSRSEVMPQEGNPQVAEITFHRLRGEAGSVKRKTPKP